MGQQQLKLSKFKKKNQGNTGRFCMRPRWYEVFFKEVDLCVHVIGTYCFE